ncbi:MAG: CFI-box-CTERM domain-containing protein [Myxococcaceae bacterium]
MQPTELFQLAEVRAQALPGTRPPLDAALERLRSECVAFFDQVPEPPIYRRADDPLRKTAGALLPVGQELLARCLALSRDGLASAPAVETLTSAVRAYLESLCHTAEGRIEAAEEAWRRATELERAATSARRLWARSDEARHPVFDRASGASRYDPSPDPLVKVKLACPTDGCRHVADYAFSPRHATHRFVCVACKIPFLAHFGEVRQVEMTERGRHKTYLFRIEELAGALSRVEFDDTSGAELSVARRDLVAFLYTENKELKGVLDLSSSRLLWIQRGGPCFVASVAFGEEAKELAAFRAYRDRVLRQSMPGRALVRGYYLAGPSLARGLRKWPAASALARRALERVHRRLIRSGF